MFGILPWSIEEQAKALIDQIGWENQTTGHLKLGFEHFFQHFKVFEIIGKIKKEMRKRVLMKSLYGHFTPFKTVIKEKFAGGFN